MSLCDVALGIWQNGGQDVVLGAGGVAIATRRRVLGELDRHDRLVGNLNEDLRRWVGDRDRQLTTELALIAAYANDPTSRAPSSIGSLRCESRSPTS